MQIKRVLYLCAPYLKYLVLVAYLAAAAVLWPRRVLLPLPASLGGFVLDAVLVSLLFLGFVFLYDVLRRPFGVARRAENTFATAGLTNARGEIPRLRSVRADRDKPHGKILTVLNRGISMNDVDQKIHRLEAGLGGRIYQMEYGRNCQTTRLYLLPMKYIHPTIINPTDEALGSISVRHLINLLVVGATGTGKTVAIKTTLSKIAQHQPKATFWILDFKCLDFKAYTTLPHYYAYTDCVQGLEDYYAAFKEAQASGVAGEPQYLIVDEWGSLMTSLSRADGERCRAILAELIALGRAYKCVSIVGMQRCDASYFTGGARDNFSARLALGNLSREGRHMVFPDNEEQITPCRKREGHLYIDGIGVEKVKMADIADLDALDASILAAMPKIAPAGGAGGEAEREPPDPPAAEGV